MKKVDEQMTDEELADMLKVGDADGDGRISFDDFVKIIAKKD